MSSMKISQKGLTKVKQTIVQKGWKVYDDRWLLKASEIMEPEGHWQLGGPYAYGCSSQTWERFLQKTAIRDSSFVAFCQMLELDPHEIAEPTYNLKEDWGPAPDVPIFYGRNQELNTLENWILVDRCRLISITGFSGVGKTRLVRGALDAEISQLGRKVKGVFEHLIWRQIDGLSLRAVLTEWLECLSLYPGSGLETIEGLISQLLCYLKQHRCLLVLDNVEFILPGGDNAGCYRKDYEEYASLLRQLGETPHQSCILLLSREKIRDIEVMAGLYPVRQLALLGLRKAAVQQIFASVNTVEDRVFHGSSQDWETVVAAYSGNPLFLAIVARHILKLFNGSLSLFIEQGSTIFGKISDLLDWHFERLSSVQKEVVYQLSLRQSPTSIARLQETLCSLPSHKGIPEILDNLDRQIPLKNTDNGFTIQPVWIEYVNHRRPERREHQANKKLPLVSESLISSGRHSGQHSGRRGVASGRKTG